MSINFTQNYLIKPSLLRGMKTISFELRYPALIRAEVLQVFTCILRSFRVHWKIQDGEINIFRRGSMSRQSEGGDEHYVLNCDVLFAA